MFPPLNLFAINSTYNLLLPDGSINPNNTISDTLSNPTLLTRAGILYGTNSTPSNQYYIEPAFVQVRAHAYRCTVFMGHWWRGAMHF